MKRLGEILLRALKFILVAGAFDWAVIFLYSRFGRNLPPLELWPLLLAPGLTFSTALLTCSETIARHGSRARVRALNIFTIVFAGFCCILLMAPLQPEEHVVIVLVLFLFFFIWDRLMIGFLRKDRKAATDSQLLIAQNASEEDKSRGATFLRSLAIDISEVRIGSRLINFPTVASLALLLVLLSMHDRPGAHYLFAVYRSCFAWRSSDSSAFTDVVHSETELFVSGLIAFHLCVASIGYLFAQRLDRVLGEEGVP